jgi:hypothetical protein
MSAVQLVASLTPTVWLVGAAGNASAATPAKDPCTLLKPAEIQTVASGAQIGNGVQTSMATIGAECAYTWGPRSSKWGDPSVKITILDARSAYAGIDAATLKSGFAAKVEAANRQGNKAWLLPGVGDAADFTYEGRSFGATAESYVKAKGVVLSVTFHGDAPANQDKIIALLKTAVGRL